MTSPADDHAAADDPHARLRRVVYLVLIFTGAGAMLGRLLAVDSVDRLALQEYRLREIPGLLAAREQQLTAKGIRGEKLQRELARIQGKLEARAQLRRPFLSANDRSRWCTIRALVEEEMHVPGYPYAIDKVERQPGWDTIDKVMHDGHYYSSKPPLLVTVMAGEYWLIHRLTGMTLGTHPYAVGRTMLMTFNVVPLLVYFWLMSRLVERLGTTDFARVLVMAAAVFGTYLTTFAVVLNNHLPAAVCALIALYAAVRVWLDGPRRDGLGSPSYWWYFVAGFFGALAAANELPALALFAPLSLALLWKSPGRTLLSYVPAAAIVAAALFGTNWIAHHSLKPPYMHRGGGGADDWYRFPGSYWDDPTGANHPVGIDQGEPSPAVYALHALVGHHGIFSLTPVWILSATGVAIWTFQRRDRRLRELALLIGAVSLVCLVYYLTQPLMYRNYGGVASGLRWMFWLAPLWLLAMLPAADALAARRWTRAVALVLLALSVLSVSYPTWNPWTHPWLYEALWNAGWIGS